ncbi:MAG: hypothetical protein ACD_28C00265G0001 [uncultured bacterium]|nr:MAG: hypothetical protein ACD_28C00265G0001 [uncultured bacterium]
MVYGSTDASGGNWPTTYYNDLNTGALDFYRVVTSSPGASTFYTYLIDGTKAIYLEGTQRAAINPSQTQLAYLESKDWLSTLMVKDLATGTILKTFTDVDGGEVNGFSWSEDGEQVRWTAISYENSEFEGVVVVNQVDLESETVASFETNSWFHCGGSCYPYPFVWAEGKTYGAILTFLYDEQDDENSYFLIYNSLGQEIGTTAPLTRLNTEPSRYNWSESGEGLIAEYSDGSSEAIAVTWK